MKIEKFDQNNCITQLHDALTAQQQKLIYGSPTATYVLVGDGKINEQYAVQAGLRVLPSPNNGGSIVVFAGDCEIAHFAPTGNDWGKQFIAAFVAWLKRRGLNASYDGNDVLLDGSYKCCGWSVKPVGNITYTAIHIGVATNEEVIRNVCLKPMSKIPRGLNSYGISNRQVTNFLLRFARQEEV